MICLSVDNLGGIAEGEPPDPAHPALAIGLAREHEMKEKARAARARLERLKAGRPP